jgi:hypothetical protein
MDYEFLPAVIAGFLGGLAMSMLMNVMRMAGATDMDMELLEGSMFTGNHTAAKAIGAVMHLMVMSALVMGSIYALVFAWADLKPSQLWWLGAAMGVLHGAIAGVGMGMMPRLHPRMQSDDPIGSRGTPLTQPGSPVLTAEPEVRLRPPGLFARHYGPITPAGVLMAHVTYGLVVGLVYWWLAG